MSTITYKKLAYQAEMRAQHAEATVGRLASRVAELEAAIVAHRDGDGWGDRDLWAVLPRHLKTRKAAHAK